MHKSTLIDIWYQAQRASIGIAVVTNDVRLLKAQLYRVRTELEDEALAQMSIRTSPDHPQQELWITQPEGACDGNAKE